MVVNNEKRFHTTRLGKDFIPRGKLSCTLKPWKNLRNYGVLCNSNEEDIVPMDYLEHEVIFPHKTKIIRCFINRVCCFGNTATSRREDQNARWTWDLYRYAANCNSGAKLEKSGNLKHVVDQISLLLTTKWTPRQSHQIRRRWTFDCSVKFVTTYGSLTDSNPVWPGTKEEKILDAGTKGYSKNIYIFFTMGFTMHAPHTYRNGLKQNQTDRPRCK